ncbi:MAG: hypothetical protein C4292_03050, partial [Nitrososphaera sp.]
MGYWPAAISTEQYAIIAASGRRARSMLRNKSVLFAVMLIAMFAVGATVAWVQDVQNTKVLLGQVVDEQNRQPIAG